MDMDLYLSCQSHDLPFFSSYRLAGHVGSLVRVQGVSEEKVPHMGYRPDSRRLEPRLEGATIFAVVVC